MTTQATATTVRTRVGRYRWVICALLFFATAINYIDRQVFSILAPKLQEVIGWSEIEYGYIVFAFHVAYALGLLGVGSLMDRIGTRKGFSLAITFWSIASMAHAFARSAVGFGVARFSLALGEAGNFPGAVKTIAEWFPKKERALATGIFNSGSNVGAIAAPLLVPFIAMKFGWQWAFILTGALGFVWLVFWLMLYRRPEEHRRLSPGELAYIQSDPAEPTVKIPWARLWPHRQTWAFSLGKFMTDPVWWFFLFWLPKYFSETYKLELTGLALPLVVIYIAADVGGGDRPRRSHPHRRGRYRSGRRAPDSFHRLANGGGGVDGRKPAGFKRHRSSAGRSRSRRPPQHDFQRHGRDLRAR